MPTPTPAPYSPLNAPFELVERDAWLDLFSAAAMTTAGRKLGICARRLGDMGLLAGRGVPIAEFNRATGLGLTSPATEPELDAAADWLDANAAPDWAMQLSPEVQNDRLLRWLGRRGMAPARRGWAKLVRTSAPAPAPAEAGLEVRLVERDNARVFAEIARIGFGMPPATVEWLEALAGRGGWRLYLAYIDGAPIATATAFWSGGLAWFGIDATLPEHRRRGAQSALIRRRIADGLSAGLVGFTAETSQPAAGAEGAYGSYSNYRKAGFIQAYMRPNYVKVA
jgi:GNAT superfamily N-acetyltransferase